VKKSNRRRFMRNVGALGATAATISVAGCTGGGEQSYDFINHFSEGGGTDANFRQIQSYWEEELDASFTQVYEGGAGTRNGVNAVLGSGDELAVGGTLAPSTPVTTVVTKMKGVTRLSLWTNWSLLEPLSEIQHCSEFGLTTIGSVHLRSLSIMHKTTQTTL